MDLLKKEFIREFIDITNEGYQKGWHERNGGNASYRIKPEEIESVRSYLTYDKQYEKIGVSIANLAKEYFLITGSGKHFRNIKSKPEENIAIIEIDSLGENYRVVWGLSKGGRPTSELPTHLMNHSVKKDRTRNKHRVIYHCHPANVIALTFVLPLEDAVFTRELWEMATECPVVFPDGIGVVDWMVPGGRDIAVATSKLMEKYNVAIWAHHGIFCSGEDFDETFGLVETVEKSAEILVKVLGMRNEKRQTITTQNLRSLGKDFNVSLPEEFLI
ncbi:MAG: rhamnulose-1-phosphate aldolase [Herbinix sp.]|nr:rhamnulose-1-phosphate aldolase [Herbinix sp.]